MDHSFDEPVNRTEAAQVQAFEPNLRLGDKRSNLFDGELGPGQRTGCHDHFRMCTSQSERSPPPETTIAARHDSNPPDHRPHVGLDPG
jgi:hypothetical protein